MLDQINTTYNRILINKNNPELLPELVNSFSTIIWETREIIIDSLTNIYWENSEVFNHYVWNYLNILWVPLVRILIQLELNIIPTDFFEIINETYNHLNIIYSDFDNKIDKTLVIKMFNEYDKWNLNSNIFNF
jgi:hypothetical protein